MESRSSTPTLAVLRACVHLLVVALLALVVARTLAGLVPHPATVTATAAVLGAVYAIGPLTGRAAAARVPAVLWLAALEAAWLALLWATPDGVWLAFPMFFLQLNLLPARWGVPVVAASTATAIVGFSWHQHGVGVGTVIGPVLGAAFAVATVLGYQAIGRESTQRRVLIEQLTATRTELAVSEHAAGALAERERLAREIHDTLAQGLSSIQLLLRAAERALPGRPEAALDHVRLARKSAQDNLAEARRFVRELTPPGLQGQSLATALGRLCETTSEHSSLPVRFQLSGPPAELPGPVQAALLRIAQSALANTTQHAGATRAEVTLTGMDAQVTLDIVDDGCGFDPGLLPAPGTGAGRAGFGVPAMRARAGALGGAFAIESSPGAGTAVAVSFPVPATAPRAAVGTGRQAGS